MRELAASKDDLAAITEVLEVTKESISEMSSGHSRELEDLTRSRVEELSKLRAQHAEEVAVFHADKSALQAQLSDLQGELATVRAAAEAERAISPRPNGTAAPAAAGGLSREDLQKLHEAHNLKMHDLATEHEKAENELRQQLEDALTKADEYQQQLANKAMEVQYLETEQDETNDELTKYVYSTSLQSPCLTPVQVEGVCHPTGGAAQQELISVYFILERNHYVTIHGYPAFRIVCCTYLSCLVVKFTLSLVQMAILRR
jgi:conserved oligomeric Golgi complex subunit 6